MGKIRISKNKLARREGVDLGLKTFGTKAQARLLKRLNIIPGFKQTRKINSKLSDYGRQIREKQKIKRIYNLSETKMSSYFKKAVQQKGNSAENLMRFIESRLDNVLYRLHLAPTRASARQLIVHGHAQVNGKKVTIPSYQLKNKDQVSYHQEKTWSIPAVKASAEEKNYTLPKWLKRQEKLGEVIGLPNLDEYHEPVDLALVIEFYSKL
jgi:small subunit ribosomal protein S4